MSRILLKKVDTKNEKYKELKASIIKQYISSNQFEYDIDLIFECSESILINDREVYVEIDEELINRIIDSDNDVYPSKYLREAELSIMLSKIFQNLPRNIIYSANIWTFLNLTVLNKAVRKLYL